MSEYDTERVFASYHERWHGFDIYYTQDRKGTCLEYSCRVKHQGDHAFDLEGRVDIVSWASKQPGGGQKDDIRELALARARAIIDLRSFVPGQVIERRPQVPRTSDNPQVTDQELRRRLLEVFHAIRRALPRSFNTAEGRVDIDGLCVELEISENQFVSAISYLLEKGWLDRFVDRLDNYSQVFITGEGMDEYESLDKAVPTAEASIFVNYREKDTLADLETLGFRLRTHFGQDTVFIARGCVELGLDWEQRIERAARLCEVMLVLIGPKWLTIADEDGNRRLDDPGDLLRREIETALERGIPIIPVLVRGAHVPREEDLPDSLSKLRKRQGRPIQEGRWEQDTEELIKGVEQALGLAPHLLRQVVRDEHGALFYIDNERERHPIGADDHNTARFLRSPKGEIQVSSEQLEPYHLGDPMQSVLDCELLYVLPGPHIYAVLNGKTYYVGMNDLDHWGRNDRRQWRHITEQEFESYPVGRTP